MSLSPYMRAMWAIVRRDVAIYSTYRAALITSNFGIIFNLALFYFVAQLVRIPPFEEPGEYYAFVVIGFVIFGVVRSSLGIPGQVQSELVAGTYERLVLSPLGGTLSVAAMLIFPLMFQIVIAVATLCIAAAVFGVDVQWSTAGLGIPVGLLGSFAFAPFALLFGALVLAFKQAPGQGIILAVVALVSGLYFPIYLLPDWLEWMSQVQPFTPTVELMRHVLVGIPMPGSIVWAVLKLIGSALILLPLSVYAVAVAGRYSRKRGTVIEY